MRVFKPLPRAFYERNTVDVAKDLIGNWLVRRLDESILVGRIVETEAYTGSDDAASHAYRGRTERNAVMFSRGGLAYVYFTYGSSFCLNATSEPEGKPGAVLIRAVEPVLGIREMCANRHSFLDSRRNLTNGPGKLCQAMKITRDLNGTDLTRDGQLMICGAQNKQFFKTKATNRVGIRRAIARKWRFYINDNKFVSHT